jgi:hypothetical protein
VSTPTERRIAAVDALVTRHLGSPWSGAIGDDQREQVAAEIEQLAVLGRTERWKDAITTWAAVVRERQDATHALIQWAIFTNYAA